VSAARVIVNAVCRFTAIWPSQDATGASWIGPGAAKPPANAGHGIEPAEAQQAGVDGRLGGLVVGEVALDREHAAGDLDILAAGGGADAPALLDEVVEHGLAPSPGDAGE